jgi:hypothetical protein
MTDDAARQNEALEREIAATEATLRALQAAIARVERRKFGLMCTVTTDDTVMV